MTSMEWRKAFPEKYKAYQREYQRKWRKAHPDYYRAYTKEKKGGPKMSEAELAYFRKYAENYKKHPYVGVRSRSGLWAISSTKATKEKRFATRFTRREANRLLKYMKSRYPFAGWERVDL